MKKDISIILGLFVVIAILMIFGKGYTSGTFFAGGRTATGSTASARQTGLVKVTSGKLDLNVEVAANLEARKKGLGRRDSLDVDRGMLFVFEQAGPYSIWMKDMKFAIDIVWLDDNKTIVDIAENVPPQPGKSDKELLVYKPTNVAKYVLEMNAGLINLNNLQLGDKVDFNL